MDTIRPSEAFPLVRRTPSAIEKAESGTKRVLSGMVVDTLALAKKEPSQKTRPLRIVMVNDEEGVLRSFEVVIRHWFKDVTMLMFDNGAAALEELLQTDPDLLITDDRMAVMAGKELCQRLLDRQVTYPVIVDSGFEPREQTEQWVREFANRGLNISYLHWPCDVESILKAVETALKIPRAEIEKSVETTPQPGNDRPLRIVVVHELEYLKKATELLTQNWLKNVDLLSFADGQEAWRELSKLDPDLLITYDRMPGMGGEEIVRRLADRRATFPIIVVSAWEDVTLPWVRQYAGTGVNVKFLNAPFDIETFRKVVAASLKISADGNHEK
jgi:FixJ family two-component response regulator